MACKLLHLEVKCHSQEDSSLTPQPQANPTEEKQVTRGNSSKLKQGGFKLDLGKIICIMTITSHWHWLPRKGPTPRTVQSGYTGAWATLLLWRCPSPQHGGWNWMILKVPSNPNSFDCLVRPATFKATLWDGSHLQLLLLYLVEGMGEKITTSCNTTCTVYYRKLII